MVQEEEEVDIRRLACPCLRAPAGAEKPPIAEKATTSANSGGSSSPSGCGADLGACLILSSKTAFDAVGHFSEGNVNNYFRELITIECFSRCFWCKILSLSHEPTAQWLGSNDDTTHWLK